MFFRSADVAATTKWYENMLGIQLRAMGGEGSAHVLSYDATGEVPGYTVWSVFEEDHPHLSPSSVDFMINYRVDDLKALLSKLEAAGVEVVGGPGEWFNGKFAWVLDPDGRKLELWEPAEGH